MAWSGASDDERGRRDTIKVGMISLGCAKNLVDGEVMLGHLSSDGIEVTADPDRADVVVVNKVDLLPYLEHGYIPVGMGHASNTLEYSYDDWCVAQMAKALGTTLADRCKARRDRNDRLWVDVYPAVDTTNATIGGEA